MRKLRLDALVQTHANVSRSKAQGLIRTGKVSLPDGTRLEKPGQQFDDDTELTIDEGPRYVSRGGQKLEAALDEFSIQIEGKIAIDVGASTGGFTDCLLQHGAAEVFAVDVGYGQLDWTLRQDERVHVLERTNIRHLQREKLNATPEIFTVDCSFISLKLILPPLSDLLARPAEGIVLIKPQFEAGKDQVGKGGVVRDPEIHQAVVKNVTKHAHEVGFETIAVIPSPLLGPAGNVEFLAHLKLPA